MMVSLRYVLSGRHEMQGCHGRNEVHFRMNRGDWHACAMRPAWAPAAKRIQSHPQPVQVHRES